MAKTGTIKGIGVRASALTPILYKQGCGRDLLVDYSKLQNAAKKVSEGQADDSLTCVDLDFVACLFWALAYGADRVHVSANWQDFVESLDDSLLLYEAWPDVLSFWMASYETQSVSKKN